MRRSDVDRGDMDTGPGTQKVLSGSQDSYKRRAEDNILQALHDGILIQTEANQTEVSVLSKNSTKSSRKGRPSVELEADYDGAYRPYHAGQCVSYAPKTNFCVMI